MIDRTKEFAEKNYNATVVYGDTDSCFVKFPGMEGLSPEEKREKAIKVAQHMEKEINKPDGPFQTPNYVSNQSHSLKI